MIQEKVQEVELWCELFKEDKKLFTLWQDQKKVFKAEMGGGELKSNKRVKDTGLQQQPWIYLRGQC